MEIKDYVGALAGKGRIVAAVAIIAGFFAVVVFIVQPRTYKATATVEIPTPPATTTSALAAVSEAYADFSGALTTDVVAQNTASKIGVPASEVKGHLSITRLADSAVAQVTYTGTDKDHAQQIATQASQQALGLVVAARLAPLDQQLTLSQSAYDDANTALQQFSAQTGVFDASYFIQKQRQIKNLQFQLGAARASGDRQKAANLQQQITTLNSQVSQNRADFDRLTTTRQAASEALSGAQAAELSEKALLDSVTASATPVVTATPATSARRLPGLIKAVVPAVVVASGLAIAMIVLLEVVGPVRLPVRVRTPGVDREAARGNAGSGDGVQGDGAKGDDARSSDTEAPAGGDDEDEEPERDPAGRIVRSRA